MTNEQCAEIKQRLDKIADDLQAIINPTSEELDEAHDTITLKSIDDIENYADPMWHLGKINLLLTVEDNRDLNAELEKPTQP